jgi:capsular polysaccharide transport system permease protein
VADLDDALEPLRTGAYSRAELMLRELGADKPKAGPQLKGLWAVALLAERSFGAGVRALIETTARYPNRHVSVMRRFLHFTGPLEALLPPDALLEIRLRLGDYYLRREEPQEAADWLRAALAIAPDDPWAIYLDANCRFALRREERAIADMERAAANAEQEPKKAFLVGGGVAALWHRIGLAHGKLRRLDEAAECLERAVRLAPENPYQRFWLGDVLFRAGRYHEAIGHLATVGRDAENYAAAARLHAVCLFMLDQPESALALLSELVAIDPLDAATFRELGRIHLAAGNTDAAEVAIARAFRTAPDLPGLKSLITDLEVRMGRLMDGDAGLPEITSFAMPAEFAPKPDDPRLLEVPGLRAAFAVHLRIMSTIMLREMLGRYSHSALGYLWAIVQPLIYVATLDAVYILAGRTVPLGTSREAFLVTGIVPLVCFYMNVQSAASRAVGSNLNLLYFREVTPLVLILANVLLEYLTGLTVFALIVGVLFAVGITTEINEPLTVLAALTLLSVLGMVVGTMFGLGELALPSLKLLNSAVNRLAFFMSGALYYANELPERIRTYALLNPLLHLIEFVRDGFFTTYHSRYAEWRYPLTFVICGILVMLTIERAGRRFIVAP